MKAASSQQGNIILWVLITVSLFAAIGVVFMRSSRTATDVLSEEQATVYANQLLSLANEYKQAIQRLTLRGCADNQLNFGNTVFLTHGETVIHSPTHNVNAPLDGSCNIFSATGAGIQPTLLNNSLTAEWSAIQPNNTKRGSISFIVGNLGEIDAKDDIWLRIPYIKKDICVKINEKLGITNPGGVPPVVTWGTAATYHGNTFTDNATADLTNTDGALAGKTIFCAQHTTQDPWDPHFVARLLKR